MRLLSSASKRLAALYKLDEAAMAMSEAVTKELKTHEIKLRAAMHQQAKDLHERRLEILAGGALTKEELEAKELGQPIFLDDSLKGYWGKVLEKALNSNVLATLLNDGILPKAWLSNRDKEVLQHLIDVQLSIELDETNPSTDTLRLTFVFAPNEFMEEESQRLTIEYKRKDGEPQSTTGCPIKWKPGKNPTIGPRDKPDATEGKESSFFQIFAPQEIDLMNEEDSDVTDSAPDKSLEDELRTQSDKPTDASDALTVTKADDAKSDFEDEDSTSLDANQFRFNEVRAVSTRNTLLMLEKYVVHSPTSILYLEEEEEEEETDDESLTGISYFDDDSFGVNSLNHDYDPPALRGGGGRGSAGKRGSSGRGEKLIVYEDDISYDMSSEPTPAKGKGKGKGGGKSKGKGKGSWDDDLSDEYDDEYGGKGKGKGKGKGQGKGKGKGRQDYDDYSFDDESSSYGGGKGKGGRGGGGKGFGGKGRGGKGGGGRGGGGKGYYD
ncbi:hypothetical protein AB1Y20_002231 [Prymnesium parvum]|uniref:Nucleosome assembly protein n=1 Tax=Prymnesium parvum TaxID=97485 RepID=A0AB34JB57_PRYPA